MKTNRSSCLISQSLEIWGDKWSLLIIRDMVFAGKTTFGDFLKSPEGIATNILTSKLSKFEAEGIIEKNRHPDNKTKYVYTLTAKGLDILPVLIEIHLWARKHQQVPENITFIGGISSGDNEETVREKIHQLKLKYKQQMGL